MCAEKWRKAEESNPHPFGVVTVFKTACRPRSETFRICGRAHRSRPEDLAARTD